MKAIKLLAILALAAGRDRIAGRTLSLVVVLSISLAISSAAWAANPTTVGAITLLPNFETMAVTVVYTDDDDADMTAVVEYKAVGDSTWRRAFPPYIDRLLEVWSGESRTIASNPHYKQVRTSIFGLTRGVAYDVRAVFADPDGVTGTNPVTATATTWSHDVPVVSGTTYFVNSATGSDANDGLTPGTAWATISKANTTASPGSTVKLAGSFAGFSWTKSGNSGAYIKIESNDQANTATITSPATISASYVWFTHLSTRDLTLSGAQYSVISHNTIHGNGTSSRYGAVLLSGNSLGLLIERNMIYQDTGNETSEWSNGVYVKSAVTGRTVIRYNTIDNCYDGMGGEGNFSFPAGFDSGSDIHNNSVTHAHDDGIEQEGGNINVKIYNNLIKTNPSTCYGCIGIAFAPVEIGPLFIFNNIIFDKNYGFKLGYGMGKGYVFNNTVWNVSNGAATAGGSAQNLEFVNNVWNTTKYVYEMDSYSTGTTTRNNNWEASGVNNTKWLGTSGKTFASMQSMGQEVNSKRLTTGIVSPAARDFHLLQGSAMIDAGATIDGISFDFEGNARPQGKAFDIGALEHSSLSLSPPGNLR